MALAMVSENFVFKDHMLKKNYLLNRLIIEFKVTLKYGVKATKSLLDSQISFPFTLSPELNWNALKDKNSDDIITMFFDEYVKIKEQRENGEFIDDLNLKFGLVSLNFLSWMSNNPVMKNEIFKLQEL